jgi:hypothetical protein
MPTRDGRVESTNKRTILIFPSASRSGLLFFAIHKDESKENGIVYKLFHQELGGTH